VPGETGGTAEQPVSFIDGGAVENPEQADEIPAAVVGEGIDASDIRAGRSEEFVGEFVADDENRRESGDPDEQSFEAIREARTVE